jgi:capsular polysaccharide biosynthesis protein
MPTELYQEEPSLIEVFRPLFRRWKLLFLGVLTGTILAALLTIVLPKQYATTVLLQMGAITDRQLEDSFTVTEIINNDAFRQTLGSKLHWNVSAKMVQAETNMLRTSPIVAVDVLADSPQHSVELANAVVDAVITRHKILFDNKVSYYSKFVNDLKGKIDWLQAEMDQIRTDLATYRSQKDPNLAAILALDTKLNDREAQLLYWKRDLRDSASNLTPAHTHNTAMVGTPVVPSKPAKPKLILDLAIGFFGSLFLMVSFILLLEQYQKASGRI